MTFRQSTLTMLLKLCEPSLGRRKRCCLNGTLRVF